MSDEEQKIIFSKNLNYYVYQSGKQQKEIAEILGFNPKTFNGWCKVFPCQLWERFKRLLIILE